MGIKREFNFDDDIELLNLKYQFGNGTLTDYFQNEIGANEPMMHIDSEISEPKNQL